VEFLAEEADRKLRIDLYHCHEFVKSIAFLLRFVAIRTDVGEVASTTADSSLDLIDEARRLLRRIKPVDDKKKFLLEAFDSSRPGAAAGFALLAEIENAWRRTDLLGRRLVINP
jgi:hypothetical protein